MSENLDNISPEIPLKGPRKWRSSLKCPKSLEERLRSPRNYPQDYGSLQECLKQEFGEDIPTEFTTKRRVVSYSRRGENFMVRWLV